MQTMTTTANSQQYASVYVGDLHPSVTEDLLQETFSSIGPVGSIRICRDSVTRQSLGYGYINYVNKSDAERALEDLNHSSIMGRPCRLMWTQRDPAVRRSGAGNIFVKNLDEAIDNKALFDTFSLFGNILSCKVACDTTTGKSRGYGFVHYETEEAAQSAISKVNGMEINGRAVEVQPFKRKVDRTADGSFTNLYTKNLPDDFTDDALKELFAPYGTITSYVIRQDKLFRNFCFVNYETAEQAQRALNALNGKDMRKDQSTDPDPEHDLLYVSKAMNKQERIQDYQDKQGLPRVSLNASQGRREGLNLYVKNLAENMTNQALENLFAPHGKITSCVAMKDDKGVCKGFGFVCYSTPEEAKAAVRAMHLQVVQGKPLYVGMAERKDDRKERLTTTFATHGPGGKAAGKGGKGPVVPQAGQQMMPQQLNGQMMAQTGQMGAMPMMGKGQMCTGGQMQMMPKGCMGPAGKGQMMGMMTPQMMNMMGKGQMGMMPNPMMTMMGKGVNMMQRPMDMRQMMQQNNVQQQNMQAQGNEKQMLGEKLYPAVAALQPELAKKITGMMLEMQNNELLNIVDNPELLKEKVAEAMTVLEQQQKVNPA